MSSADDPNLKWDGQRWLRWNGNVWVDASTGQQIPGQQPAMQQTGPYPVAKTSHTVRNIIIVILALVLLGFGGCAVLVIAGIGGAADQNQKAQESAAATCAGKTYLDSQPHDVCAGADNTVTVEGLTVTAAPLTPAKGQFGDKVLCSEATLKNSSGETKDYNVLDFKIQTPSGDVATTSTLGFGSGESLNSGALVNGGTKQGQVCSDFKSGAAGQYVLIYDPNAFTDPRGIWLTEVK